MAGRKVSIPLEINKIATIGSVPVINSMIFTMGYGHAIINGLPDFARKPKWKYQIVFEPSLAEKPVVQSSTNEPNIEELYKLAPDIVFSMDIKSVELLESKGFTVIFLLWTKPEDIKKSVKLLGEIFNKRKKVTEYINYFDYSLNIIQKRITSSKIKKAKALYFKPKTLTQPHLVADWWIREAGGISVTDNNRKSESYSFDFEQLILWNPDVLIVTDKSDIEIINSDMRFSQLKAVKDGNVYITPMGSHVWANRTIEQPLMAMWAAKKFYPELFDTLDIIEETIYFYRTFFGYELSLSQAEEILSGKL